MNFFLVTVIILMNLGAIGLARLEHSVLEMLVKQNAEIKDELKSIKATMFELLRRQKVKLAHLI